MRAQGLAGDTAASRYVSECGRFMTPDWVAKATAIGIGRMRSSSLPGFNFRLRAYSGNLKANPIQAGAAGDIQSSSIRTAKRKVHGLPDN